MVRIMRMRSQSVLVGMVLCEEVRKKCSQALIPSLCGILVYSDETSSVTIICTVNNMYLLTEWEGRTGKYLARGHGVRTERSEVRAP